MKRLKSTGTSRTLAVFVAILAMVGVTLAGATMTTATAASPNQVGAGDSASGQMPADTKMARAGRLRYGAMVFNIYDGAVGWGNNYRTKAKAKRVGMRACRARSSRPAYCRHVAWVRNGCASVAMKRRANGTVARYAAASPYRTKRKAARAARKRCGVKCRTRATICTVRYY